MRNPDHTQLTIWGAGTARTLRPIWVAEELGLDYRLEPIGPRTGETKTKDYTSLNPKQKIPFCEVGTVKLSETVAICRYLVARFGNAPGLSAAKPTLCAVSKACSTGRPVTRTQSTALPSCVKAGCAWR